MIGVYDFSDLKLAANPLALGRHQGNIFKRALKEYENAFTEYCLRAKNWNWLWARKLSGYTIRRWLFHLAAKFEKYISPIFKQEMIGISQTSGVSYDFIRFLNVADDIANTFLCSATAVWNPKSMGYIYGANLDYPVLIKHLRENVIVVRRLSSLSVSFPGYIGVLRGVNRWNNVLISLTSKTNHNRVGIPNGLLYRSILEGDCGGSPMLMAHLLKRTSRGASNNVLIGNRVWARIIESVFDCCELLIPDKNNNLCVTNHFSSPTLIRYQSIVKPLLPMDVGDKFFTLDFSRKRLECLKSFCRTDDNGGLAKVKSLLNYLTTTEPLCNDATVFTTIFDLPLSELTIHVPHRSEGVTMPFGF